MNKRLPCVGITHGDTNGIGYEVILKTFSVPEMVGICTPVIYGAAKALSYHRKAFDMQINTVSITTPEEAVEGKLNLISVTDDEVPISLGRATPEAGMLAFAALERAVKDLRDGKIDVLVTAPVNKATIQNDGFRFCGHTEYIEEQLRPATDVLPQQENDDVITTDDIEQNVSPGISPAPHDEALMILMNDTLCVALVTTHLPLRDVAKGVTLENIVRKLRILDHSMRRDFGITRPRIAVLSLNPHAGDDGLLGDEEQTIIKPAMEEALKAGVHSYGPYPADGFFGTRAYEHYDAVLAMYHDQGLAAFKALAMESGVNYTAGLSHVRTSPDHGVAYDIAGKNQADETSFRQAVYTAIDIQRNRDYYDEAHSNPLRKLYHERKEDERPFSRQPQMRKTNATD